MKTILQHKTRTTFILFLLLCICLLTIDNNQQGTTENIQQQDIQFSKELGWVNWSHAIPTGTKKAYNQFVNSNELNKDSFNFVFEMDMKIKIFDNFLIASCSQEFTVAHMKNHIDINRNFAKIFASISIVLEEMQGSMPYCILSGSRASSFRNGDLTGNLLSLYLATHNRTLNTLKHHLTLSSIEQCLSKHKLSNIDTNKIRNFTEINLDVKANPALQKVGTLLEQIKSSNFSFRLIKTDRQLFFQ